MVHGRLPVGKGLLAEGYTHSAHSNSPFTEVLLLWTRVSCPPHLFSSFVVTWLIVSPLNFENMIGFSALTQKAE